MTDEPRSLDVTLTRECINLSAHAMAMQVMLETLLERLDGDEFDRARFRLEMKELTEKCREQQMLQFEKLNPGIAAFLDAHRPLPGGDNDQEE